ncbi:hypothetical protein [Kutzneria chonburiensis]|uniref:Uncharacterized protein n=1 Tax=Kutzneria chonburiensis TaxID=1483604 RepID=A0ABV6MQL6_9PSEU
MAAPPYAQALHAAEFITGPPMIKGIPLWRAAGIQAVRLLTDLFLDLVARHGEPTVLQHGFLADAAAGRQVFGAYDNVYDVRDLPGHRGVQFRSDNIVTVVTGWSRAAQRGPVVSIGEVIRDAPGKTPPLFRDRSIWPVVELNHIVAAADAESLLTAYATIVEDLLAAIGIPTVTVRTPALAGYGKLSYLTVAVLPNKRPTVLATLYVLTDELRSALGVEQDVIDVGFTGKILATTAMLHADARGLVLPSAIAPTQVGVTLPPEHGADDWLSRLRAGGLRCDVVVAGQAAGRDRAERAWHRRGVPLVIGLGRAREAVAVCTRLPMARVELPELPEPQQVRDLLAAADARLATRATAVFESGMAEGGHLRSVCGSCSRDLAVFGAVVPGVAGHCDTCGGPAGEQLFVSDEGRFY